MRARRFKFTSPKREGCLIVYEIDEFLADAKARKDWSLDILDVLEIEELPTFWGIRP